jgi:hypothetical protein
MTVGMDCSLIITGVLRLSNRQMRGKTGGTQDFPLRLRATPTKERRKYEKRKDRAELRVPAVFLRMQDYPMMHQVRRLDI